MKLLVATAAAASALKSVLRRRLSKCWGLPWPHEPYAGASQDQADAQRGKKSTFQAIHLQFFVIDIVSISLGKPKTGFVIT
jgi:hypothetical protein